MFSRLKADPTTLLCCSGCGGTQCSGCWAEQLPVIIHVAILARFRLFSASRLRPTTFEGAEEPLARHATGAVQEVRALEVLVLLFLCDIAL